MIALGLSLLFGMGWAIGLLASSDLPDAVRYPAEWVFTLTTAFLGVYLFVLYVLRSQEARKLWKRWLCCQSKKKRGVSFSSANTQSRNRLKTLSSTLTSWKGTLKTGRSTTSMRSDRSHANLQPVNLELVERMKPDEWTYSDVFSSGTYDLPTEWAKEGTGEVARGGKSGQNTSFAESMFSVPEEPTDGMDEDGWFYNKVYVTQGSQDKSWPIAMSISAFSSESDQGLSGTQGACYIVENKQFEGPDVIPL